MSLFFADLSAGNAFKLPPSTLTTLCIGMVLYCGVMLFIGWWSSRKVQEVHDFLVAGRRLPLWMATATLLATWFGAGSSMGVAATVYKDGINGVLADPFGAALSLIFAGIFIVGLLRKKGCMTVTDIIARRYGEGAGIYASLWMIPVYIGWLGAQLKGLGTILNLLTGMSVTTGTWIGAVVVLFYTCAGGMWAVTLTDVVQVGIMIIGLLIIMPGAVNLSGGAEALMASLSPRDLSLLPQDVANANDVVYYIGSWIIMGLGCMVGQDLIQRSLSSRDDKIAVSSSIMSGFFYLLVGIIPITIGFCARLVFKKYGIDENIMGGDLENQVLPRMAMIILGDIHPILLTIFLSALVAAIMSSADSSLLAGASLLCNNVLEPFSPGFLKRHMLGATRITTVLLTVIALYFAINVESIYALMINSWISQLVVVFLPVMMALYLPRSSKQAAWATMLVGTAVWLGYTFITSCGSGMTFVQLLDSDRFDRAITCGAVYGFVCALLTAIFCCCGERISANCQEE
ncbi:MAG: sodium:solute symporter family protein [Lentisphaeria bacterium]|nr:sodium:solute symporter family protein [Lentisphaeria bacterium]